MPNQKTIDHYRILALQNLTVQLPGVAIIIVTVSPDDAQPELSCRKFSSNIQDKDALSELFLDVGNGLANLKTEEIVDLTNCKGGMQ